MDTDFQNVLARGLQAASPCENHQRTEAEAG
jgi:hypothetical protein